MALVEVVADGFSEPTGLVVDQNGALFVSDRKSGTLFKVSAGEVHPFITHLSRPVGMSFDLEGRLLVVEEKSGRLLRVEANGNLSVLAEGMGKPRWLAVAEDTTVYISAKGLGTDEGNDDDEEQGEVILRLTPDGILSVWATGFKELQGLVVHENSLFAASKGLKQEKNDHGGIFKIPIQSDGKAGLITRLTQTNIKRPFGLALDALGAFYVTAEELEFSKKIKDAIGKVVTDGTLTRFASKLKNPRGLAFDNSANLYVADGKGDQHGRVLRLRAPPPPTLAFPSFTSQNSLILNGKTEANSRIDAFLNDSAAPITVSTQDGSFALTLNLKLNAQNFLDVFTTTHSGQGLTSAPAEFTIVHDNIAPFIANIQPINGSFLNNPRPLIQANFSDNLSGVDVTKVEVRLDGLNVTNHASVTPSGFSLDLSNPSTLKPLNSLTEGLHTVLVTISDRAGNSASTSSTFAVDITPPLITNLTPADGSVLTTDRPLITAQFNDNFGINLASVKIFLDNMDVTSLASITPSGFTLYPFNPLSLHPLNPLTQGSHTVFVSLSDLAGNPASVSSTFTVTTHPEITVFSPGSGTVGTEVTIQGRGFDPSSGKTIVKFNGVQAIITSVTETIIRTFVPLGATTGRIAVETPRGIGTSSTDFIVLLRQDFVLSASPAVGTAVQGMSATYALRIISTGPEPFTGLASLAVAGLLPGITANLMPSTLGPNGTGILTLTTTNSTPVGAYILELRATAQIEGRAIMRTATITLGIQAPGQTILTGEVRDEQEIPLAGVSIKLGGSTITELGTTDAGGNFFIPLSVAGPQVFLIDGSTANTPSISYSTIPVTLDILVGIVNSLGFTPKLHGLPVAKLMPIIPAQETVLAPPDVPGFKMEIPSGVQIIGWDNQPNTQVSVTAVPIDRSPLPPLPPGLGSRQVYLFNFGKMGGGIPTGNVPIDTPNDVDGLPGDKIDLYYFNEAPDGSAPNRWEKYGTGTVSPDGSRIITDINPATNLPYGIPRFCCGARVNVPPPQPRPGGGASGGQSGSGQTAGEPVDTATGFFYLDKTDMVLPGILPTAITRTYRTQLTNAGPFGLGTSWPYDIFLQPPPNNSPDSLIFFTPGNRQDLFARQPDGSFINTTSPSLRGAVVTVVAGIRSLRFKDGSLWRFDGAGRLISQADRNGNTITLTRDTQGRVTQITEPSGRQLTLFYTGTNLRIDRIQDPIGRAILYGYDASGRLITVTDATGGITRYTYDGSNRMVTITDPRNITFLTNEYDAAGRVIRQTQADGGMWTFTYTASGNFITQTTVADPRGNSTTYRFNSSGFLISQTNALGQTTSFERQTGTNLLLSTSDSIGRVASFAYDANGNVTTITDPAGNVRGFEYEPTFNKLTKITDPLGHVTTFEYDAKGNLTATVDPTGARTTIAYNEFGQPLSTTDPLGNSTTFTYDSNGNLAVIADPLGNTTQRAYDLVSRLIEQTDPRGRSARFSYDGLNRIAQVIDALNGVTSFSYDGNGNLLMVTDARGHTIAHTYDSIDRLATRADPLGRLETYQYDRAGNLIHATDRKQQVTTLTYDALDRRISTGYADGTTTRFVYDAGGRLIEATDSAGGTILNSYDLLDRLTSQSTGMGTISYQYDSLGRRISMAVPGQALVTYSYDINSQLTEVLQGSQFVNLSYDALGRRTRLTVSNGVSTEYVYDPASRLTELIYRNTLGILGNLTYQYDPAGNRAAVGGSFARTLLPDPIASAIYDAANQQLAFGNKTMTFDANGNLTSISDSDGVTSFTWDARNQLINLVRPNLSASFGYDALGRRTLRTVNGLSYTFQYDGRNVVSESAADGDAFYLGGLGLDDVWVRRKQDKTDFVIADALGSSVANLDALGTVASELTYEPFGRSMHTGVVSDNPISFTGREDDGTGLFHYRARYYHPDLARYISEDPLHFRDGINAYTYVRNNPINARDPFGLLTIIVHGLRFGKPKEGSYTESKFATDIKAATGETIKEVLWSGNVLSGEGASDAFFQIAQLISNAPPGEPINIIGHSWGSVLAANYLAATGSPVDLLITIGSPLSALTADPASASVWVNITSVADPISWGSLTSGAERLVRVGLVDHTGYWNDPVTKKEIIKRIKQQKKRRK
ncbi:MAG: IPT/TIG domain-containing protein [Deltaproteobacteria bacterium]|nr:IPT/TIG domain-containing protein [Deltaproteobacteria bacterium]